jgi:hypothetical protein
MSSAVLRAAGATFDAAGFAAAHHLVCDAVWRAGDVDRRGRVATTSGFNTLVTEAATSSDLVLACGAWLREHETMVVALSVAGAESSLDVALFVSTAHPARSVALSPELLELCVHLGVAIEVSAYATSDESGDAV